MNRAELYRKIEQEAKSLAAELTAVRRDLHKYPEAGWFEVRTSSLIARKLTDLGYEVLTGEDVCKKEARMGVPSEEELEQQYERAMAQGADPEFAERMCHGMTGVIGILHCGPGPVTALRFDMDALGVVESGKESHRPHREGFASVNHGFMHACGHDGHTAIGLGTAAVLMKIKAQLHGTVKLIFQPSEEGVRGAAAIVERGHLSDVQYFLGAHLADREAEGEGNDLRAGYSGGLATTKYDVTMRGRAAHAAACPEEGQNVLLAASAAIQNLYAIPGMVREILVNVGTIHGGSGRNVVPDEVKMELEIRGETREVHEYMKEYTRRVLEGAAAMHGVTCEIRVMGSADSLAASPVMTEHVYRVCSSELHLKTLGFAKLSGVGSEDVSYMMREVQDHGGEATFMRMFASMAAPLHSRSFDFDETVLPKAVIVFCALVFELCSE